MDTRQLLAITAAISLPVLWLLIYPSLAAKTGYEILVPEHHVMRFRYIPVITDPGTMVEVSGAITMTALPLYLYARRRVAIAEALDQQVAELLALYASLLASTGSAADALLAAARILDPPMSMLVEKMARIYKSTGDLDLAFREAFREAPRKVRIYAYNIVAATRSRGLMHRVLGVAASHAQSTRRLLNLVKARLSEYGFIGALASITYAFSAGIVVGLVKKLSLLSLPGFGRAVNPGLLLGLYYYTLIVIILAAAFIVARVVQGHSLLATKYIVVLTLPDTLIMLLSPMIIM